MNLSDITKKCFILTLFIRSDGERFLLGDGAYEFKNSQQHFEGNALSNDVVEPQGNDGYLLAGQVRRPRAQSFDGYVGSGTTGKAEVEQYRRDFFAFFRKNFFYTVIYVFSDGSAIQRKRGFLVDAPEIKELYQIYPQYHIAVNFEDVNYYRYAEDDNGDEIYGKSATIALSVGGGTGGLVWDEYGIVWDEYGAVWEDGSAGGPTTVAVDSIDTVWPVWEVKGPAVNPTLTNLTTNESCKYTGTVTSSQTLRIDMLNQTATLNGTSVIKNVDGYVSFVPGNNRVTFTCDNSTAPSSNIFWQEVVG